MSESDIISLHTLSQVCWLLLGPVISVGVLVIIGLLVQDIGQDGHD